MKLIIVDRGVVIDHQQDVVSAPEEWRPVAGSAEALARMVHAGYHIVVMADQTVLERGICDMTALNAAHGRMIAGIEAAGGRVDAVFFRPAPGAGNGVAAAAALRTVLDRLHVPAEQAIVVSDSPDDLLTAREAGCRSVLVLTGSGRRTLEAGDLPTGSVVRVDLSALASDLAC